ncbi:DUF72 domain-containing protein [Rhodovastum atsumiense]|uniref:DUF72 domain-containing protein n=1 Tax=Rhodovastum atsumiense TaxID=504468 RepID=A0A5M6IU21_9PROT|nr:DUF72 domain-containing protein [Rhodovastum atsumiense]KAA5611762.1 DUF72 domain-containing protein [Rhodovastum atsumiense]CAH2604346.1 DUF72 domain-containing protein [Rhodovastum atsumiense]
MPVHIGIAGWSIPPQYAAAFPAGETHLARYARRFGAVEINSSFYRPHRLATYERWARSVPEAFRFAVKLPKEITHVRGLEDSTGPLLRFLAAVSGLGDRLGPLLVQLPPALRFAAASVEPFLDGLRQHCAGEVVCEPRHASWFTDPAEAMLRRFAVARVAADPAIVAAAAGPGGDDQLVYHRLHGSPQMYYSAYPTDVIEDLATRILRQATSARVVWCIFDNTARGEATNDALRLCRCLADRCRRPMEGAHRVGRCDGG